MVLAKHRQALSEAKRETYSGLAQRKRTGLIIQGSIDRNYYPLKQYETSQQFKYFLAKKYQMVSANKKYASVAQSGEQNAVCSV